jgi:hypothetical protein
MDQGARKSGEVRVVGERGNKRKKGGGDERRR